MEKFDNSNKNLAEGDLHESCFHTKERKENTRFLAVLLCMLIAFMGLRALWTQNFGGIVVDGASMNRTLSDGDMLLMRYTSAGAVAKRGDVIIVDVRGYLECGEADFLIKRLIATEGDKVKCEDGKLYICYAGQSEYTYLEEDYAYYYLNKEDYDFGEYVVGKGEIFFLGDNRQNSKDSRYGEHGGSHLTNKLYKAEDIYGVVPSWAIEYKTALETVFFHNAK